MASSLESLHEIKLKALQIQSCLEGADELWSEKIKETYRDLVDRFYQENEDMIPPQQYEAAKKDFEYFMRLVDLAMAYYQEEEKQTVILTLWIYGRTSNVNLY